MNQRHFLIVCIIGVITYGIYEIRLWVKRPDILSERQRRIRGLGLFFLLLGFLVRLWAVVHFYNHSMRVISLEPQGSLVTAGPYRYSRNPLYLGANVFCFFGAALLLGSPTALIMTAVHLPFVNLIIRREERQLEQKFGDQFRAYKRQVRRWL